MLRPIQKCLQDTDPEARLWLPQLHHLVFNVDGLSRTISTVVNGFFGTGGNVRPQGWAHLEPIGPIGSGAASETCTVHHSVRLLRVYSRSLSTTEAIGNWRDGRVSRRRIVPGFDTNLPVAAE